ncbi:MAG TPA: hypothetical protein ENH07_10280 [Nitrospirae bacterium]|nr:hypothetical protein [Nitrospirota bacterium]
MLILDLSGIKGKRPQIWPDEMPTKIRLIRGKHEKEFDIHPIERKKGWYLKIKEAIGENDLHRRIVLREKIKQDHEWPVGIDHESLLPGAKIIERQMIETKMMSMDSVLHWVSCPGADKHKKEETHGTS